MLTNSRRSNQLSNQKHKMQQHPSTSCYYTRNPLLIAVTFGLLHLFAPASASVHPVLTYTNASTQLGQLVTSSTLVWETYDPKDPKQLKFAVEGGKYITNDEHYPIYVCRVAIEGITTSGHTEKILQSHVCVAAHYKHGKYEQFDVLVNKGHLGKIMWKHWRKFNAGIPIGAIRIGEDDYIGRHKAPPMGESGTEHRGADYNLGRLDPLGLGKIKVIENGTDREFDEGEVLVETEPFRYELRDIKLDSIRLDMRENITDLASSVLANRGDMYILVESVMTYEFDHVQYWGSHEGVARGLPTKVYEKDAVVPAEIKWGLKYVEKRSETKSVHTKLWPGTALNVTLKGNYVTLEAPYTAKLYAFYYGIDDSVSRKITAEVRKSYLKDVKLHFSPVYWIENGTIVPTTTTTSTTSTSTTTNPTTTSHEPVPMHEPPVVQLKDVGVTHSGPDSLEKSLHDSPSSNEIPSDVPENLAAEQQKPSLAGIAATGSGQQIQQQKYTLMTTLSAVTLWGLMTMRRI
ncbi:protein unzipped [Anastrepha obliqua]|uniref:protein unzipped n=1 Tax=Anastrepha obliqua TaxID=95512 RepID=UPI002409BFA2|nr:protein unzipped [Anastrepha obliqua]